MVSSCPFISNSCSPFTESFGDRPELNNYNWYHRHIYVSSFSLIIWQVPDTYHIYPTPPLRQDMTQGQLF